MTRILSECSASVRKSFQGLDYFAAEGARAFNDLSAVLEQALENGARKERAQGLQEALKAGKLYLKSDFVRSGLTSLHGRRRKGSREESLCALSCVRLK